MLKFYMLTVLLLSIWDDLKHIYCILNNNMNLYITTLYLISQFSIMYVNMINMCQIYMITVFFLCLWFYLEHFPVAIGTPVPTHAEVNKTASRAAINRRLFEFW